MEILHKNHSIFSKEEKEMQYLRRRKIPEFTYSNSPRTEIFGGSPVKYIIIRADTSADFAVEINGVEIIDSNLDHLNKENAVRYGFDFSASENADRAILSFEEYNQNGINNTASIRQLTFVAKAAATYDLTVVDIINI